MGICERLASMALARRAGKPSHDSIVRDTSSRPVVMQMRLPLWGAAMKRLAPAP